MPLFFDQSDASCPVCFGPARRVMPFHGASSYAPGGVVCPECGWLPATDAEGNLIDYTTADPPGASMSIEYKGYVGVAHLDAEAGVIRGKVVNTRDTITFRGATADEVLAAFRESVDDYIAFRESLGETPEMPETPASRPSPASATA